MIEDYFRQYGLIALYALVALSVPLGMLAMSRMGVAMKMRPQRPTPVKLSTYESGVLPIGPGWTRFNFRYYYFALLFVVFDVETVFLYPWAVRYGLLSQEFGAAALIAVVVFLAVVTLGYVYAWRKRALEWV